MSRMLQLIRVSAMPSHVMHTAARGALAVPPGEMIEILVYLALHNKVFGQTARMTLAGWDEAACRAAAADPQSPKEVLDYFVNPSNLRPALLPALLENPSVQISALEHFAESGSRELAEIFLRSPRAKQSTALMSALRSNPNLAERRVAAVEAHSTKAPVETSAAVDPGEDHPVPDETVHAFMTEYATEIATTPEKPFQAVSFAEELPEPDGSESAPVPAPTPPVPVTTAGPAAAAAPAKDQYRPVMKHAAPPPPENRESAVQKIKRLDVKGRIQLAIKGNKEERSILIRDSTKIVALAVLDSPKVTDSEVEKFATQKNVLEALLRAIPLKRRYAKQYAIVRNLVSNPRTPLDVSLALMKHLLTTDLKNLSANKEVPETVRKLALRMVQQKAESEGK